MKRLTLYLALGFVLAAVSLIASDADACGMFARVPGPADAELLSATPYLAVERTLLIWDKETKDEDFIREARFEQANQGFGFVVPTPTKPEISAVKNAPFERLQKKMPFVSPGDGGATRGLGGSGKGSGEGAPPEAAVQVLAQQRIGSFTAFTLQASEAGAFDKWLTDNGFVVPTEARPWLEHYIKLKFFFVAFKYQAAAGATKGMTSETVRIRFKTPKPYYPYMDATSPKGVAALRNRLLLGWTITREPMIDVASMQMQEPRWRRPWAYGVPKDATAAEIEDVLGAELGALVPKASMIVVQPFRDLKASREGYGDVVLVPARKSEIFTPEDKEQHRLLLGVIDPVLLGEKGWEPNILDYPLQAIEDAGTPLPSPSAKPAASSSCASAPGGGSAGGWLFAIVAIAFFRRRGLLLALGLLGLLGCKKPDAALVDAGASDKPLADSGAITPSRPLSSAAREGAAFDVMMGEVPSGGILADPDTRQKANTQVTTAPLTIEGSKIADADRVVAGLRARFRLCYAKALEAEPELGRSMTKLVVHAVITPTGEVASANAEPANAFGICVASVVKRAQFAPPEPASETKLTIRSSFDVQP